MKNGKHLILDAYGCSYDSLWDTELIKDTLLTVTSMIGLRPLSDTLIYEVDESMIDKKDTGVTGGIIFMESHFTFHSFPEQKYFSADIYSCNTFDHEQVIEHISKVFNSKSKDVTILIRGSQLK
jgi:S-adenosylmethionine/arginine decarboxylase-like enzyme